MAKKCSNTDCGIQYHVEDEKSDDGFCCFTCWEQTHCKAPRIEEHTSFDVDLSKILI